MCRTILFISFLLLPAISTGSTILLLKDGGTINGELLNPDEINRKLYRIKTTEGLEISLDAKFVERIQSRERPAVIEYNVSAPLTENTLENHLYWTRWCNERQLPDHAKLHWQQILAIDPDNVNARLVLGYTRDPKDPTGWISLQDRRENRGFIEHKGRWKTEQQIEVETMHEKKTESEQYWRKTIQDICRRLPDGRAEAELLAIRDPAAINQLGEALRAEKVNPQKRVVLIRSLVQVSHVSAFQIVAAWSVSINEPSEDIRQLCIEELKKRTNDYPEARRTMVDIYRGCLRAEMPLAIVRMAAKTLGDIEGYEAIPELIEVLEVTVTESSQEQSQGYSFGPGGTGFSQGAKPVKRPVQVPNQEVLTALRRLTGVDFGYNQSAWRSWYRQTQRSPSINVNLRRI